MGRTRKSSSLPRGAATRAVQRSAGSSEHRLREQAQRFYRTFSALIRAYQFRDREGMTCLGLSVSQCYALDALEREGPMPMGRLSAAMFLDVSTMTRVVDQLVAKDLAVRAQDAEDRRVCRVKTTAKGRSLHARIQADLVSEYERVLSGLPAGSREAVIESIAQIHAAFRAREGCATASANPIERPASRQASSGRGRKAR